MSKIDIITDRKEECHVCGSVTIPTVRLGEYEPIIKERTKVIVCHKCMLEAQYRLQCAFNVS